MLVSVVQNAEFAASEVELLLVESGGEGFDSIATAGNDVTRNVDNDAAANVVAFVVVAYTIDTHQIALVLDGSRLGEHLPGFLTGVGPVGNNDDGVVFASGGITAPTRKAQVVAGQYEQAPTFVLDDEVTVAWRKILVFVTIRKEVALVVVVGLPRPAVDEIVTIAECAVGKVDSHTAAEGTMIATGSILHPLQRSVGMLLVSDMVRLGGKSRAPHLGQHIEVAAWFFSHHALCLEDVLLGLSPLNIGL